MTLQFHSWAYIQRQPESKIYKHPNVHTSAIHNGQGSNLNARWRWMALENFPMIHSFSFLLCQLESHKLATPNTPRHLEVCLYYPCLMAPHSSTLAWQIPWMEEPGRLQSMGSLGVRHDWATSLSLFTFTHWRRKWQPTPVFLPGESQGRGSLVGCHLWGRTESDTTEAT